MLNFPTIWQAVIFRNYGIVPKINISNVLHTTEENVIINAKKLGIDSFSYDENWLTKGFVTIIRSNWDILSIENISILLDISIDELKKILVEYDFLDVKLGPQIEIKDCKYYPLTVEQESKTKEIQEIIKENILEQEVKPFDFYSNYVTPNYFKALSPKIKERFMSSYSARYSGALLDDDLSDYTDEYLSRLSKTGSNGIWLSDTLRNLAEFPFDKSLSLGYEIRIKNLRKLTERCAKYGINVYLYMNEPRSLNEEFFNKYQDMRGEKVDDGTYCLCTSNERVKEYIFNAFKSIAKSCPLLKGIMTITMSENPTHCYSRYWGGSNKIQTSCPRCRNRKPGEVVSEINNIISRALKEGNNYTKLISNIWGWKNFSNNENKEVFETIDLLDKDIDVLCVSEYGKEFLRGGIKCSVDDYSISVVGPSDFAKEVLSYGREKGHKVWAKVQMNNSWECSAVPYIPVFDLMENHIRNLHKLNVDGIMLGWSLGGYLGGVLPLINSICEDENFNSLDWYKKTYGKDWTDIKKAVSIFSNAFINYPFSVESIYLGGHTLGPGNMWNKNRDERNSTMVCFTFDDYERFSSPYGIDKYIELLKEVCLGFNEGFNLVKDKKGNEAFEEFKNCAKGTLIHLQSALNLAIYSREKRRNGVEEIKECIDSEKMITKELLALISKDNKIGFEMTNHYYYTRNILLEKIINLTFLLK